MMINPTGSALDRVARCAPSAALPQVIDANDHDDRDKGSVRHQYLERVAAVGREVALAEVDEQYRGMCADIELAKLADQLKLSTEVALAYNWRDDTARVLTPVAPRVYDVDVTCEIAGTFDLAGVGPAAVYLGDYKGAHGWLPAPGASYQLGLGALCLARIYDRHEARVEYIRLLDDGGSIPFRAHLDVFALEAVASSIRDVMESIPARRARFEAGEVPTVVDGPWCRYCPARQHCPGKTALVRAVLRDTPIPYAQPLTPDLAREGFARLREAKKILKEYEGALYSYAKLTPIPIETQEDGSVRWFGEWRRPGNEVLDGAVTHAVLTERYGGAIANAAVSYETTKKAISDAVRKALPAGEKITKTLDAIYADIRARRGAKNPETCTTVEYVVSPDGDVALARKKAS